ncbi:cupin domain-containing protein [Methanocrinis sp.]|uniref:cupin domain-containing protein n=1 Tax=Methanocrinis sp. TaxID=3101522 RepID=UPI003D0BFEB3
MFIKNLEDRPRFVALDRTEICELLHPDREDEVLFLGYSLAHARLGPGEASRPHRLKTSSEVYFILEGRGRMTIEGESAKVGPGMAIYIPPGSMQHIENRGDGPLAFLCIVRPSWKKEDEVLD